MVDVKNLGAIIRWPFELLGKILNFFFKYFIEALIIIGAIILIVFLFKSGIVQNIANSISKARKESKLKGGNKNGIQT